MMVIGHQYIQGAAAGSKADFGFSAPFQRLRSKPQNCSQGWIYVCSSHNIDQKLFLVMLRKTLNI